MQASVIVCSTPLTWNSATFAIEVLYSKVTSEAEQLE